MNIQYPVPNTYDKTTGTTVINWPARLAYGKRKKKRWNPYVLKILASSCVPSKYCHKEEINSTLQKHVHILFCNTFGKYGNHRSTYRESTFPWRSSQRSWICETRQENIRWILTENQDLLRYSLVVKQTRMTGTADPTVAVWRISNQIKLVLLCTTFLLCTNVPNC